MISTGRSVVTNTIGVIPTFTWQLSAGNLWTGAEMDFFINTQCFRVNILNRSKMLYCLTRIMVHSLVIRKSNYSQGNQGLIVTIKIEIHFTTTSDTEIGS